MICVSCDSMASFNRIDQYNSEIKAVEPDKPVLLILTKSDLEDQVVTFDMLLDKSNEGDFFDAAMTSSKAWEDFNVHRAFNQALMTAYLDKVELEHRHKQAAPPDQLVTAQDDVFENN